MDASYVELKRLLSEVLSIIEGARVENLYHMEDDSVILKLRKGDVRGELRLIPGVCFYFTHGSYEKPLELSARGRALRGLVAGAKVLSAEVIPGERIMVLGLERGGKRLKLVSEFIPRGTITVLDEDGRILESLHRLEMRDRRIAPGEVYRFPPPKPSVFEEVEGLFERLSPRRPLASALAVEAGLGGRYAEEVIAVAGVDGSKRVRELSEEERGKVAKALEAVLNMAMGGRPVVALKGGEVQALPYRFRSFEGAGWRFEEAESLNEAFREGYERFLALRFEEERRRKAEEEAGRLREEARQKRYVAGRLREEAEALRRAAEKLFAAGAWLEELRKRRSGGGEAMGVKAEVDGAAKRLRVEVEGEVVELRLDESVMKQVSRLYDKAKKAGEAAERLEKEAGELERKAERVLRRAGKALEEAYLKVSAQKLKPRREWYERFRWFETSEGFLAVAGRDASSNRALLKKYMEPGDLVFHAEVRGAPALLLKDGASSGEKSKIEAAQFAAAYSKAWREGLTTMTVYYVNPGQVSFSPPPGHYLPKGGFIIKGERNYLTVKLELAFGLTKGGELVYGPPSAVKAKSGEIVKVVPGRRRAEEVAEEVLRKLTEGVELDRKTLRDLRRMIAELIPYGSGELA